MREAELLDGPPYATRRYTTRSEPHLVLVVALLTAVISMAICAAAILAPAPAAVVPLVVTICVGAPVFAGWEAPLALASVRAERSRRTALARLRHSLDQLPEVEHPLGH